MSEEQTPTRAVVGAPPPSPRPPPLPGSAVTAPAVNRPPPAGTTWSVGAAAWHCGGKGSPASGVPLTRLPGAGWPALSTASSFPAAPRASQQPRAWGPHLPEPIPGAHRALCSPSLGAAPSRGQIFRSKLEDRFPGSSPASGPWDFSATQVLSSEDCRSARSSVES